MKIVTAVGIDVSKGKSTVAVMRPGGEVVCRTVVQGGQRCILQSLRNRRKRSAIAVTNHICAPAFGQFQ